MGIIQINNTDSTMLSRVAAHMYWMSRYLERAENTARLIDVHLNLMLDSGPEIAEARRLDRLMQSLGVNPDDIDATDHDDILRYLTFDEDNPFSILYSAKSARENARQIREQISSEMWLQINRLYLDVKNTNPDHAWGDSPHNFYALIKEGSHLFQGITDATMNHNQGWYFIQIGRYLERLSALVTFIDAQIRQEQDFSTSVDGKNQYFELVALLKSISAFEAYCKVYNPDMQADWIVEFILFSPESPRSARFCIDMLLRSLENLAAITASQKARRANRLAGRLQSALNFDEIDDVLAGDFQQYLMNIKRQAYQIHDTLFETYITYPIETALK